MGAREPLRGFPYETIPFDTPASDFELRAAVAGKHIVVIAYHVISHVLDQEISFVSDDISTGDNDITGALTGLEVFDMADRDNEYGLFWTRKGEKLSFDLGGIDRITGFVQVVLADFMPPIIPVT